MRRKQRIEYPGAVYHVQNRGNYRKEYADGNGTDYSYDAANRLSVRTWDRSGGLDTIYEYDLATTELVTVDYESLESADIIYTYDRIGGQSSITDATGTRSFQYDASTLKLLTETLSTSFYGDVFLERTYEDGSGKPRGGQT